ncbi:thiamine phosphate synthase [Rhizobium leguminosarum]|uniref:ThiF family adenylyltransferase n=1 Tax=Rhizobium leguminosarum TaxID=384 RepID=UPI0013DD5C89|nr:ThiF family adenylyltransferase [Rhizobium leguminosarum]MBY5312596.1 thiamine phosphate synthase [Rhizobium leguminosarum]NEH52293.1 thiamine phosphate synthase [Rhizobium leguminosarum]
MMVNYRFKRLSAAATASVDFPNLVTHSLGRGGQGALFTGNSADSVEEQSPHVTRSAFVVSLKASDMPAEDEYDSAAIDHHGAILTPLHRQRDIARFGDIDFVIIGCGDLGSQIAIQLAALGARHFLLVDADRINENDLNRLPWASEADVGWLKTDRLATHLAAGFSAYVFTLPEFAEGASALRLIADYANNPFFILAGDDSSRAQDLLSACRALKAGLPPHLHVGRSANYCMAGPLVLVHEDACSVCHCATQVATDDSFRTLPATVDNPLVAGLAASQIAQNCLSRHSVARGRQWILDLKGDQAELRSLKTPRM